MSFCNCGVCNACLGIPKKKKTKTKKSSSKKDLSPSSAWPDCIVAYWPPDSSRWWCGTHEYEPAHVMSEPFRLYKLVPLKSSKKKKP